MFPGIYTYGFKFKTDIVNFEPFFVCFTGPIFDPVTANAWV